MTNCFNLKWVNAHTESMIRTMAWRDAIKKADLKGLRIHDLGHTYATRVGGLAYPVQTIQVLLRHSDIRTSMRYLHPGQSLHDAVENLSLTSTDFSQKNGGRS